ncbi:MAG: 23S rRNA (uracil(1939)-C(5))-methyltransferase RlmD [Candidatus Hinthialibacter antarcticus]|nr:23S rRNA (uracil(1939)-C(5))-methyltransferase RlmD [Candidatus Hinthialibacter antarcticus]
MKSKNPIRIVTIDSFDGKGRGKGTTETGGVLSVPFTAPGDVVEAAKTKSRTGRLERIVTPSPQRIDSVCRHFALCGGCSRQFLSYAHQLEYKKAAVAEWFQQRQLNYDFTDVEITPSPPYGYRNRMDFVWNWDGSFGLREQGCWYRVVDLSECHLLPPDVMEIAFEINRRVHGAGLPFRDSKRKTPGMRYLIVRRGVMTGEVMLLFVSDEMQLPESLWSGFDRVASVYQLVNNNAENDQSDGEPMLLSGSPTFRERVLDHTFDVGPRTFFQPNPVVAGDMASHLRGFLKEKPGRRLLDLFCGAGFFSALLADVCAETLGVELVAEAAQLARRNAPQANAQFVCMEAERMASLNLSGYDVLLIDPPRSGLHPKTLKWIEQQSFEEILYVSCNPKRGAEDIALMREQYQVDSVALFDQFPQTPHVEMIARLVRTVS